MDDETGKWPRQDYPVSHGSPANAAIAPRSVRSSADHDLADVPYSIGRDGRYRVQSRIAETESSYLFDAWDSFRSRRVAIKQMRMPRGEPDEVRDALIRFEDSAEAGNHPNIVKILKFLELDGNCYIVMEFLEGGNLAERIARSPEEPLTINEIQAIMSDLLLALDHSHSIDLVHRDVKPANLLLSSSGQWKLTDFGIARFRSSTRTQYGTFIGTPAYASPEQVMGRPVDPRTDLYSCGVVLYELLTGHRPFRGSPDTVKRRIVQSDAVAPSTAGPLSTHALDAVVARAMAKDPDQRFESAAAFRGALDAALRPGPVVRPRVRPFDDPERADYGVPGVERQRSSVWRWREALPRLVRDRPAATGRVATVIFLAGVAALGWRLLPGPASQPKPTQVVAVAHTAVPLLPVLASHPLALPPASPPLASPPLVPPPLAPPSPPLPARQPTAAVPVNTSADTNSHPAPPAADHGDGRASESHPSTAAAQAAALPNANPQYVRVLPDGVGAVETSIPDAKPNEPARAEAKVDRTAPSEPSWRQKSSAVAMSVPRVPAPSSEDFALPSDPPSAPALAPPPVARSAPSGQQVGLLCQPASSDLVASARVPTTSVPLLVVTGAAVGMAAQRAGIREGDILEKAGPVSKPGDYGWGSCLISPTTGHVANVRAWRDGDWRSFAVQLH